MFRALIDVLRGLLIGVVEIIPGVSGGTVALIVGVYERLIGSAGHLIRGVVRGVADLLARRGSGRAREHFAQVSWRVVIPVMIGMVMGVLSAAALLAPIIESHPVETRAVFMGLVLASVVVPVRMTGRWSAKSVLLAVAAAVPAFILMGLPNAPISADPPALLVAVAAAVAVCALVLPGVSGSFLLVVVGLYAPTLAALNDRDFGYIAVFVLGAVVGLSLFVPVLQWTLENRRSIALPIMTGLMLGSARALWPWQASDGTAQPPSGDVLVVWGLVAAGIVAVLATLWVESRLVRRRVVTGTDVFASVTRDDDPADRDARVR